MAAAGAQAQSGNQQKTVQIPFRKGSRQRKRQSRFTMPIGGIGQRVVFELDKVGMLNYLVLFVKATVNFTSTGSYANTDGPWSLIDRIRVDLNLSNMNLYDLDGPMAFHMGAIMYRSWFPHGPAPNIFAPSPLCYQAGLATGDNQWVLPFFIPISSNEGDNFDTGLINLQAPEVQTTVEVRIAPDPTLVATGINTVTNVTGSLYQCYFSTMDPRAVILPLGKVVRTIQQTQSITNLGENIFTVPRQGKLLNIASRVLLNGQLSDSLDRLQIVANINDTMYDEPPDFNAFEYQRLYSSPKPVGIFTKDFWHAKEFPSSGDGRDLINMEVLTTFQKKIFVSNNATLGTTGNNLWHIGRRVLVAFQSPATSGVSPLSQ